MTESPTFDPRAPLSPIQYDPPTADDLDTIAVAHQKFLAREAKIALADQQRFKMPWWVWRSMIGVYAGFWAGLIPGAILGLVIYWVSLKFVYGTVRDWGRGGPTESELTALAASMAVGVGLGPVIGGVWGVVGTKNIVRLRSALLIMIWFAILAAAVTSWITLYGLPR